jgi:uncharacterized repeat protein (TIGR03833 family)
MSLPRYNQISVGAPVSIILKDDQPTGRQVQGRVAELLTHGDHPRGVKVRLSDGRVGRVQRILTPSATSRPPPAQHPYQTSQPYGTAPASQEYGPYTSMLPQQQHNSMPTNINNDLLPQGRERSEQVEYMQSYEAAVPQSEDDTNQATLQKEFPNIDSSLIAAIYGDSKNMGEVREMLQELSSGN